MVPLHQTSVASQNKLQALHQPASSPRLSFSAQLLPLCPVFAVWSSVLAPSPSSDAHALPCLISLPGILVPRLSHGCRPLNSELSHTCSGTADRPSSAEPLTLSWCFSFGISQSHPPTKAPLSHLLFQEGFLPHPFLPMTTSTVDPHCLPSSVF